MPTLLVALVVNVGAGILWAIRPADDPIAQVSLGAAWLVAAVALVAHERRLKQQGTEARPLRYAAGFLVLAALAAIAWTATSAHAQTVITIPRAPSCANCRIVTDSLFALGTVADSVRPTTFGNIERDTRGRFYALSDDHRVIVVFDPKGRMIGTIGRRGQGPGEFSGRLWSMRVGANDTVYVADERQIAIFDRDWRFVRRVRLPSQLHMFYPLPDGRFVGGMMIATRDQPGRPFHIFNADGTVMRSFGPELPPRRGRGAPLPPPSERTIYPTTRFTLAADKRSIWAPASEYAMERWSLDGHLLQRYVVDAPWMQRGATSERDSVVTGNFKRIFTRRGVPEAELAGVDASGSFWFNGMIPVPGSVGTVEKPQPRDLRREIVNFAARRIVVSAPAARYLHLISGSDLAVTMDANADDELTLAVWRIGIRRP